VIREEERVIRLDLGGPGVDVLRLAACGAASTPPGKEGLWIRNL
jgi:hypothetical protein